MKFAPFYTVFCLIVFFILNLYKSIWRYASYTELLRLINATVFTFIFNVAGTLLFIRRMPISYYIVGSILQFLFMITIRFSYRFVTLLRSLRPDNNASRVMIVGAGSAGLMILRDIRNSHTINDEVVCFIIYVISVLISISYLFTFGKRKVVEEGGE
jgi:FlaA1/EpsC-like NDP-sugar epimerase